MAYKDVFKVTSKKMLHLSVKTHEKYWEKPTCVTEDD